MTLQLRTFAFGVLASLAVGCSSEGKGTTNDPVDINSGNVRVGDDVDLDGDNISDGRALDTDGDGVPDALDTNGDGIADKPLPPPGGAMMGSTAGDPIATGDASTPDDGKKKVMATLPVTLVIHDTSRLSIGSLLPEFAYKGGQNKGTLTLYTDGTGEAFFRATDNNVTPLEVIPGGLGEVRIAPNDMTGQVDFCTGIMTMPFDAKFTPVIFGMPRTEMSVITDLTTETSKGMNHELMGKRLDASGNLKLVGIAVVPKTDDITVDGLLGLPADAVTNMDGTLMVEGGLPKCPATRTGEIK